MKDLQSVQDSQENTRFISVLLANTHNESENGNKPIA